MKKYIDGCNTVEEYKASIQEDLEEQNKETEEQKAKQEAWNTVMKNSEIHEYPKTILAIGEQMYDDLLKQYADTANTDEDGYLETIGVSKEENQKKREEYAKDIAKRIMVCNAICEKEGYEVTCLLRGLGENETIRQLYVAHAQAAVNALEGVSPAFTAAIMSSREGEASTVPTK